MTTTPKYWYATEEEEVRKERDARLTACDWTILPDSPLTTEEKTAWQTYRQALRDLPDGAEPTWDGTTLGNVTWPQKPA